MLRPPTESMELNRSISLYLREITASMFWKIVFSFSAEFLKSSGHNDVRKKAACFCHMFSWGDERWSSRVASSLSADGWRKLLKPSRGSGKGNQRPVGGAWRLVPPMSFQQFWEHTKYVFPNIIQTAVDLWCYITINFPYMATRFGPPGHCLHCSCLRLYWAIETYLLLYKLTSFDLSVGEDGPFVKNTHFTKSTYSNNVPNLQSYHMSCHTLTTHRMKNKSVT